MVIKQSRQDIDLFEKSSDMTKNICRMSVLLPIPVGRPYDYLVDLDEYQVSIGDYVTVPVGRRELTGVVWHDKTDENLPIKKLKYITGKHDCPPMSDETRQFIDWVARYTVSDRGSVLKMVLNKVSAITPLKTDIGYILSDELIIDVLNAKRRAVADCLIDGQAKKASVLAKMAGCTVSVIKTMAKNGLLQSVDIVPDMPCSISTIPESHITLSEHQAVAAEKLVEMMAGQDFQAALLDGVTGAGKTEVYFEAVAESLKQGRQALVLLPEIALSVQFIDRFSERFGVEPAIWHSDISVAQKKRIWRGVASGQTKCVIGARSALFLPYVDLGVIIVDEEHDGSFKQEEGVIYHARDMAIVCAKTHKSLVVLVSATPSLETMVNAQSGRYEHICLPSRHGGAKLPDIHILDLREHKPERQMFISEPLRQAIREALERKEQAILFLNRRGYAPLTLCRTCGHRFQCPSCTAWLVEHRYPYCLQCHHCGYRGAVPKKCPECEDEGSLIACGPGVERIAEEVEHVFPDARTLILASDITHSPKMLIDAIKSIKDHEVDIIIGTQIIAKGHHFPLLTCVGVVDADLGLAGVDLRASERTFQLLHQVSGRAGRGALAGHVYLQTYMPDNRVICALAANDRDAFLKVEEEERRDANMPPFGRLASLIISAPDENMLQKTCQDLAISAPRYDGVQILGPAPAALALLRGQHRQRFLIKTDKSVSVQKLIRDWLASVKKPANIRIKIDIDPQNFL